MAQAKLTWWRSRNGSGPWVKFKTYSFAFVVTGDTVIPALGFAGRFGLAPGGATLVIDQNRKGLFDGPSETAAGAQRSVGGVIVDSRGYVATSYRAIRDAVSIEVRASSKALVTGDALGELSDNVRGLIASIETHDLAILQINRRFVSTFANVSIVGPTSALPGDRCIVAAPPTDQHRIWLADFPIRHVQPLDQLLAQFQTAITECKLDSDAQANWIVGAIPTNRFVPGSPIFSLNGELVGLLTAATVESHGIACSGTDISDLVKTSEGTPLPFPIDSEIASKVSDTADIALLMPLPDSRAFPATDSLNQAVQSIAQNDLTDVFRLPNL